MTEPTDINLRHLDGLVAAHRLGSVTAAAAAVNMSQSNLTEALSKIEEKLGRDLFRRRRDGISITEDGRILVERATRAIAIIADGVRVLRRSARLSLLPNPQRTLSMTQLRAFLEVYRAGSFTQAARNLKLAQPSVYRATRDLELRLGVDLFIRAGRTVQATVIGEEFARHAALALLEIRAGLEDIGGLGEGAARQLAIGVLALPLVNILPNAINRVANLYSQIDIRIVEARRSELISQLRKGDIDVLIDTIRPDLSDRSICQRALFSDRLCVVGSSDHPLQGTEASASELLAFPWLTGPSGSPLWDIWARLFEGSKGLPPVRIECTSIATIKEFLLQGDWLTLMSPDQFQLEASQGRLSEVRTKEVIHQRQICLTTRSGWKPTAAQACFVEVIDQLTLSNDCT